jgi:hypothetical protein
LDKFSLKYRYPDPRWILVSISYTVVRIRYLFCYLNMLPETVSSKETPSVPFYVEFGIKTIFRSTAGTSSTQGSLKFSNGHDHDWISTISVWRNVPVYCTSYINK